MTRKGTASDDIKTPLRRSGRLEQKKSQKLSSKPLPPPPIDPSAPPPPQSSSPTSLLIPSPLNTRIALTDEYVRSLFPGYMFGLADEIFDRGYWSVAKERALRLEYMAADAHQLHDLFQTLEARETRQEVVWFADGEMRLWDVLHHRFRCGLDDLFRYGLKPDLSPELPEEAASDGNGPTAAFLAVYCDLLTAVLTHPIWGADDMDIAPVRWLLQRVIQERLPGHPRPIVPPYSYWRPPFVDMARQWAEKGGSQTKRGKTSKASKAKSSQEAAQKAEAEMTWFSFMTHTPRDVWYLDMGLDLDPEPGDDLDESDIPVRAEREPSTPPRVTLPPLHPSILGGTFGSAGMPEYSEFSMRYNKRIREDAIGESRREQRKRKKNADVTADLPDEQVFFYLNLRDIERMLDLLGNEEFLSHSGYVDPLYYFDVYFPAHAEAHRHGAVENEPLCHICSRRYHQGPRLQRRAGEESYDSHPPVDHIHRLHQLYPSEVGKDNLSLWMMSRKCEWLLAGRREELVRKAMAKEARSARRRRKTVRQMTLPDVPPFDPEPVIQHDRIFTDRSQLAVFGRKTMHASKMWCFMGMSDYS